MDQGDGRQEAKVLPARKALALIVHDLPLGGLADPVAAAAPADGATAAPDTYDDASAGAETSR
jgi:hypothetical protein